jgi:hypothetical protein
MLNLSLWNKVPNNGTLLSTKHDGPQFNRTTRERLMAVDVVNISVEIPQRFRVVVFLGSFN